MGSDVMNRPNSGSFLLAVLLPAACGVLSAGETDRPAVVLAPEALPDLIAREGSNLVLLDCRSRAEYDAGQVAGARWVDAAGWKQASLAPRSLKDTDAWAGPIAGLGLRPDTQVVVYDDGTMTEAARLWFLLQYVGIRRVTVLDGGFPELKPLIDQGRIRLTHAPARPAAATTSRAAPPPAPVCPVHLADKNDVLRAARSRDAVILDVRTDAEYQGLDNEKNPRHGHIPGAVHLPHARLLQIHRPPSATTQPSAKPRGRLRPPAELRKLFSQAGLSPDQRIITHCQSGGRAALAALALVHAGYGEVDNYYRSFAEWSADPQAPIIPPAPSASSPSP